MFKSLLLKGRTICLLLCCLVSSLVVTAQTKHSGKVIGSDDKLPIVGASVRIKGSNTGAVTDVNGDFTLTLATGNILEVSYIGYTTKTVTVQGTGFLTISLDPVNNSLNEVVVTGYTSQRKKDIAGAVSVVDMSSAKKLPSASTDQLLQGQASGVTVVTAGSPGQGSAVFIRGISNFANAQPLYVIDGVQATSMQDVNPNDIESIQVLKDAGSAAIYGVSGGNGVIVVTTKGGKPGKSMINYDAYYGVQLPKSGNVYDALSPKDQSTLTWFVDPATAKLIYPGGAGTVPVYGYQGPGTAGVADASFDVSKYKFDASNPGNDFLIQKFSQTGTDWFHAIFKQSPIQYHTLSASGANDKNSYFFSVGYLDNEGTEQYTYLKRYETRINTAYKINDHIRIGENAYLNYKQSPYDPNNPNNQSEGDPISYAYRQLPQIPVYDISGVQYGGTYDGPGGEPLGNSSNPLSVLAQLQNDYFRSWNIQGSMYAEADVFKYITLKTSIGGDIYNDYANFLNTNPYNDYEGHFNANGAAEGAAYTSNYIWTNTLHYRQTIGKHNISFLAGYEQRSFYGRVVSTSGSSLFSTDPSYVDVSNTTTNYTHNSAQYQPVTHQSLFGQLQYIYNDKYILSATVRRDGSSVFYTGRQFGVFPSASFAWRISNESFLKPITWINDLKLRASYGQLGSDLNVPGSNPYSAFNSSLGNGYYAIGGTNQTTQGFYASANGNIKTTWETDKVLNFGIDASLFNHLDVNLEYYQKKVSGLLFNQSLPGTVGSSGSPKVNIGDVQNNGFDLSAVYHGNVGTDFKYNIGANITAYRNKITNIPGKYFYDGFSRANAIVKDQIGEPVGEFFGYKVIGFYNPSDLVKNADGTYSGANGVPVYTGAVPGSFKYADVNHDGVIDDKDRTFIGNPNPDFTYGVNLSASYKGWDVSIVLYGSQGNQDFHYTNYFTDFYSTFNGGKSNKALYNSYGSPSLKGTPTLPIQTDSHTLGTSEISSYYVEDGSFLKAKVAQIGYNFSPSLLKAIGIAKLHVYVQGTNLFTLTKYTGLDPELIPIGSNSTGVDYGAYPNNQRQYIMGVNMSF
jgi:TonB-linked SusC/RagA family outer membrane protein